MQAHQLTRSDGFRVAKKNRLLLRLGGNPFLSGPDAWV